MSTRFRGHIVLITGASSGIGAALAREFAGQGADVILLARRKDRLEALATEIVHSGRRAVAIVCDVTSDVDVRAAILRARQEIGPPSVVVANAGFGVSGAVERLSVDDYRRQFETNVLGVVRTIHETLPDLRTSRGRLVLLGSVAGYVSMPDASAYAMSKAALRALALAQSLRHELRSSSVAVTLISPGFVDSEIRQVDNLGTLQPAASDPVPARLRMRTDVAARQIVDAVAHRRREAVITRLGKVIVFVHSHAPWLIDAIIQVARVRNRREPASKT